jgi:hypothetical protein
LSRLNIQRQVALGATVLLSTGLSLPFVAHGASTAPKAPKDPNKPRVTTGGVHRLTGTSAQLTGVILPKGQPTSYYFQWGPTIAYGAQTPTASAGSGPLKVKVGQTLNGLQFGVLYHFRIVGVYSVGGVAQPLVLGRDRTFSLKGQLKFEVPKIAPVTVGSSFIFSGVLRGVGNAKHPVSLQASVFPYTEPPTTIGIAGVTDPFGRFAFRVAHLTTSTSFRVVTIDPRPIYSPIVRVGAAPKVTLHVRTSKSGLVRLYGTVTPSVVGAQLVIQLRKPIKQNRPTKSEATTRFVNAFTTVVKKGTRTSSRFSVVVKVRETGRYRALVKVKPGALVPGSSATVVLHAPPGSKAKPKH